MTTEHEERILELMEKYSIEELGGCHRCQPNADMAKGWGCLPSEIREELWEEDSCCEEIMEDGRIFKNYPTFCKWKEEEEEEDE
jgi:hypothetical protein